MQVDQEGQGDQQTDENSPTNKVSCASCDQTFMLMLIQWYDMYYMYSAERDTCSLNKGGAIWGKAGPSGRGEQGQSQGEEYRFARRGEQH